MNDTMALEATNQAEARRDVIEVESQRAIQEVQAAMTIAQRFPRNPIAAHRRIMDACKRPSLAKGAVYSYPKGKQEVTGPSIRLAEVLAQNWGNIDFGIKELSQANGKSIILAYAWDLETNTRSTKEFTVPHQRYTKKYGNKAITDPREIYEHTANMGARRMRACILAVIPGDIVDEAVAECDRTLEKGDGKPLADRIRDMLGVFGEFGVTQEMLEERLSHKLATTTNIELANLGKIYRSLKDGMSGKDDWFDSGAETQKKARDLTKELKGKGKKAKEEPADASFKRESPVIGSFETDILMYREMLGDESVAGVAGDHDLDNLKPHEQDAMLSVLKAQADLEAAKQETK